VRSKIKKSNVLFLFALIFILLSGCSKSNKPNDISQEIWDEGIQVVLYINKITNEFGMVDPDISYGSYLLDEPEYTKAEENLYFDIIELQLKSMAVFIAIDEGSQSLEEDANNYEEAYKKFEELFGKEILQNTKIDYEFLLDLSTKNGWL